MVCVAINKGRYTLRGIRENRTFSLNIPSENQVVETDHCGLVSGANEDKSPVFRSVVGSLVISGLTGRIICQTGTLCATYPYNDQSGGHQVCSSVYSWWEGDKLWTYQSYHAPQF